MTLPASGGLPPLDQSPSPLDRELSPLERGAGTHIVADLIGASRLDDPDHAEEVLRDCAEAAGASLLYIYVHRFGGGGGVSGVALLAESHISVHSWPEYRFAAVDMFMCGAAEPSKALPVLQAGFEPERIVTHELMRGRDACTRAKPPAGPDKGERPKTMSRPYSLDIVLSLPERPEGGR